MYSGTRVNPKVELTFQEAIKKIQEEIDTLETTELDIKAYDNPAWAYKQAYKNGYKRAMKVLLQLLDQYKEQSNERPISTIRPGQGLPR